MVQHILGSNKVLVPKGESIEIFIDPINPKYDGKIDRIIIPEEIAQAFWIEKFACDGKQLLSEHGCPASIFSHKVGYEVKIGSDIKRDGKITLKVRNDSPNLDLHFVCAIIIETEIEMPADA